MMDGSCGVAEECVRRVEAALEKHDDVEERWVGKQGVLQWAMYVRSRGNE